MGLEAVRDLGKARVQGKETQDQAERHRQKPSDKPERSD